MADKTISELYPVSSVDPADLFVLEQAETGSAKKLTGQVLENWLVSFADGHGGIQSVAKTGTSGLVDTYTITYADETTSTFTVTNAKSISSITQYWAVSSSDANVPSSWSTTRQSMTSTNRYLWSYMTVTYNDSTTSDTTKAVVGVYGDTGNAWYVHIKYASQQPTSDADMGDIPDDWIGIYSGTSSTAPATYTSYTWYEIKGATGDAAAIQSSSITYQSSTSGTAVPSGTWESAVPTVNPGNYLWTKVEVVYDDANSTTVTSYSVARMGVDGSGTVTTVNEIYPVDGNITLDASDILAEDGNTVQSHITNNVVYLTSISCSATTGNFATVSDSAITANHVVAECVFANPSYIGSDVTWTTASGSLVLNGTCFSSTTANVVLVKKDN